MLCVWEIDIEDSFSFNILVDGLEGIFKVL